MKTANVLAAAVLLGVASIPLVAQQPGSSQPQQSNPPPPAGEQASPATEQTPQATQTNPSTTTAAAQMSPVNGELIQNLDSKTAKAGDSIVIKTKSAVTTADGTQIPKGSKLVGHVMGVKASGPENANSQVALQFDHAELKSGQSVPIHSEIQSLAPSDGEASSSAPSAMASAPSAPKASGTPSGMSGSSAGGSTAAPSSAPTQMSNPGAPAADSNPGPVAGTVVARTGNIAIRTTSIPGVLLAINEPGQQDPRMAQSSGILLGAKRDIHLDEGTNVVIGVAASGATPGGN
jgi:hypothetical protein